MLLRMQRGEHVGVHRPKIHLCRKRKLVRAARQSNFARYNSFQQCFQADSLSIPGSPTMRFAYMAKLRTSAAELLQKKLSPRLPRTQPRQLFKQEITHILPSEPAEEQGGGAGDCAAALNREQDWKGRRACAKRAVRFCTAWYSLPLGSSFFFLPLKSRKKSRVLMS